jgi:ATP-dependent protease Clp ATPase subunit
MTVTEEPKVSVACSFCLKPTTEVGTLVAGPGVFICDVCVTLCVDIIANKPAAPPDPAIWDRDLTDAALLELLPKVAAAGAQVERHLIGYVRKARARGVTWNRIGAALGVTRQSAWERFSGEE